MAMPDLQVEVAFTSGYKTAMADRVYTDISPYVRRRDQLRITHGRADEEGQVPPDELSLVLENLDGRFTPGNTGGAYSPNVKLWRPIRVRYRYASDGVGNMLTANQASFETDVSEWSSGGSNPPARASSTTHASVGTKSMLVTWGTGGTASAFTTVTGLAIGRTYTFKALVWVPTGSPNVFLSVSGITSGSASSGNNAFVAVTVTFVAASATQQLAVLPVTATTAGQQVWVDCAQIDQGTSLSSFTTSPPVLWDRFTGYVDDWPVAWPDGGDAYCVTNLHAISRRARLTKSRKLNSAIREAILATDPQAYWPMDEDEDFVAASGQHLFRDITNTDEIRTNNQLIASFYASDGLEPIRGDGTLGPTDEKSLVKFARTTDPANADWNRYVGGSGVMNIGTAVPTGELMVQLVTRVIPFAPSAGANVDVSLIRLFSVDGTNEIRAFVFDSTNTGGGPFVGITAWLRAEDGTVIENPGWFAFDSTAFATATDGEIHHFGIRVDQGGGGAHGQVSLFLDGSLISYTTLVGAFTKPFTTFAIGSRTLFGDLWAGHVAVHDRVLDVSTLTSEFELCANAAIAATEELDERVVRLAGRVGIDSAEVTVQDSWAQALGRQSEAGRTVPEILDEIADGTAGIAYDTRSGLLGMLARNTRYNQALAFTLGTSGEEIEATLAWGTDDQKLVNIVDVSRLGVDAVTTLTDDDSVDDNGDYPGTVQAVTSSDQEAIQAGYDVLYRFADPQPRVVQVAVELRDLTTAQRNLVLAADISTRFGLSGLPSQAPASSATQFAEGFTETLTDSSLLLEMNTSPGGLYQNVWMPNVNDTLDSGIFVGY